MYIVQIRITVEDRMFLGMQDFSFGQIFIGEICSILLVKVIQILPKFAQKICGSSSYSTADTNCCIMHNYDLLKILHCIYENTINDIKINT